MIVTDQHKRFITDQMAKLEAYDSLRPKDHVYEFHLHSERVAQSMKSLAIQRGYDQPVVEALYWATLPHDIGKRKLPVAIWDTTEQPTDEKKQERRAHVDFTVQIIRDYFKELCDTDPLLQLMLDIGENHHEAMNGTGFKGKTADNLSQEVRMACICDAFDGWSIRRPHFDDNRDLSPKGVITRMETEKAGQFDPDILKSFKEIKL